MESDVVLAYAGDTTTLETIAAEGGLRQHLPELKVQVVNFADLMALYPAFLHPHGIDDAVFAERFTAEQPVMRD